MRLEGHGQSVLRQFLAAQVNSWPDVSGAGDHVICIPRNLPPAVTSTASQLLEEPTFGIGQSAKVVFICLKAENDPTGLCIINLRVEPMR